MADQIQFRGGPSSESATFTGASREITVDTTLNTLRVHDGSTAGGTLLAKAADLSTVSTAQTAALTALGVASGATNLGTFTGSSIGDSLTVKQALQTLETILENKATLHGVAVAGTHLGTFSGSTIPTASTIKDALQALETSLEAVDIDTDDMAALVGLAENVTNLGTFTGSTIDDNQTVKQAVQALETAVELRANADTPAFTGNLATLIGSATLPVVHRIQGGFPDINLRTNGSDVATDQNEGRLLWEDAGGGGVAAIKQTMLPTAPLRFFVGGITDSEERLRILANGRVGIGETSPQAQLHVGGSVLVKADFPDFQMRSGGERRVIFEDAGGGAEGAVKFSSNTMTFFTGGISSSEERLRIAANGRVGIGTASPAAQLHVSGSALVQAEFPDFQMRSNSEKRLIFEDDGGAAQSAIKVSGAHLKLFAGGVASGDQIAEVNASGITFSSGKALNLDSVALTTVQTSGESFADNDTSVMTSGAIADYVSANSGMAGVTATAAELNILDGATLTTTEINYVDGVTSSIQTQLNTQAALTTAHGTILGATAGTAGASQAVILDANKDVTGLRNLTLTGNLSVQGTTTTVNTVTMEAANAVVFEGATADDNETTLTIVDPNADRTIKLPNQSGCLPVLAADSTTAITATPEELNILDGVTSTAAELNILDGVTATAAELNYVDGVTSAIQTQLDAKFAVAGGTATGSITIEAGFPDLTLKSNGERRLLFADSGGSANAGLKYASSQLQLLHGGVASGNVIAYIDSSNFVVNQDVTLNDERVYFNAGSQLIRLKDNETSALKIENHDGSSQDFLDFKTSNSGCELIFGAPNQINNTVTVGVDDTGYDVKFFGATASAYMLWDESADDLILAGAAGLVVPDGQLTLGSTAVTSTAAELNILDGVTSTAAELNILDGVTATAAELNILDGVTSTAAELNILDGVTSTAAELNLLDGVTATTAELNYVDGVTSNIQSQLDALQASDAELTELATMSSNAAAAIADLTQAEVQILDGATVTTAELNILDGVTSTAAELNILDGVTSTAAELNILDGVTSTAAELNLLDGVTATTAELNYVDGVTSAIQTQLDAKLASSGAQAALHVDHIITLSGVAQASDDLGTFTGSTINDNVTIKAAIQALETAVETKQATDAELTELATMASATAAALADLSEAEVQILDGATVTTAELNILDGVTSTAAELNILDGVTSTAAELNILDGVTSTAAELNILDGVTSTAAELNLLDGVTATTAELNYVDGVTSAIQTQLDAKLASTGAQAALHVDHLITLSGVAEAADNLGTFTGSTISDNGTVKAGMQELETAVETKQAADAELTELATMASATAAALADLSEAEVQILDGATVTTAELNILDGVTSTAAELNILDGVTSTAAELNILDGVTSTAAELNILDGVTSTAAELNILDGVTASAADINLIDGITNGTVIASKAIITDSDKDISGGRNITITGELDAATLDISGDADIDGTANLDAVDIDGAVDMASTLIFSGGLTNAADDTAAASAGVAVGQLYRNGSVVMIRVS